MYTGGIDSFPAFFALLFLGLAVVIFKTRIKSTAQIGWILVVVYFAVLISVILFPLPINQAAIDYGHWRTQHGLGPRNNWLIFSALNEITSKSNLIRQVGGNVLLFAPLGSMLSLVAPRWKVRRDLTAILLTSSLCELSQLATNTAYGFQLRSFDIDDIWLNFLGGCIGLLATQCLIKTFPEISNWANRRKLVIAR